MPALTGFSNNAFRTYDDFRTGALSLLQSLCQYQSEGGARIKIPVATGAHFDETAAQLEGYARPLWAIGALLADESNIDERIYNVCEPFVKGLRNGTDPQHPEYWGPIIVRDQRMVEMEIISFVLLAAPHTFFHEQTASVQANIVKWLSSINGKDMPTTNWLWFRVLTNLALTKTCGVSIDEIGQLMTADLLILDTFRLSDGWSSDGVWSEEGRQADYYSGSFAIQFSQLMFTKYAHEFYPMRCEAYKVQAIQFSKQFLHYFDKNGAAIPFGRSLTYRFAFAGFWAALAFAEVELPESLDKYGIVKGLLLRHFRWWSSKTDIFNMDGTMSIGFLYPNMYMSEDYNSPQSVYWCMKSFCALGLPQTHEFWRAEELPLPSPTPLTKVIPSAMHIICDSGSHHFALSSGQFCPWPLKATEAKYGKYAYSSHFGFSIPTGPLIQQIAPDSTLALQIQGDDVWKVRWIPSGARFSTATVFCQGKNEIVPVLVSSWKPWRLLNVSVQTALIAPSTIWPDWHVRIHRISIGSDCPNIDAIEGGFAIYGRQVSDGLPLRPIDISGPCEGASPIEGTVADANSCLVCSADGASGIRKLKPVLSYEGGLCQSEGAILKPDANTNLMRQRTVIPTLKSIISADNVNQNAPLFLVSGVFASAAQRDNTMQLWNSPPVLHLSGGQISSDKAYISFDDF